MKYFVPLLFALTCAAFPLRAELLVQPNDRVLVACEVPLSQGMVSVDLAAYFLMCQPVDGLTVIDGGNGEGLEQFMRGIPTNVAPWNPNVALISHGIADGRVGKEDRGFTYYHPTYLGQTLDALKKINVRTIVLGSASAMNAAPGDAAGKTYNDHLAAFRDQDRDLAAKNNLPFVDVLGATLDAMTKGQAAFGDSFSIAANGTNLTRFGQLAVTGAFLKALGADGAIGTITVDLAANTATGTPGQKIVSIQSGSVNVESTRYPFCFTTAPPYGPEDETAKYVSALPFNQDVNRYLLIVKGLATPKAKVTWGADSREITSADLAQGVNLAAVFAGHTPFDTLFNRIVDHIWQRQLKQFIWTDGTFSHLDDIRKMAPGAPLDDLVAAIHAQDAKNGADVQAMVVPVQHTIKIEPEP